MSFCLECGFVVHLAVFVNQLVSVLLHPVLYLHQSGSSCVRDRTHPGIIDVRPRCTGVYVSVCINMLTGIADHIVNMNHFRIKLY